MLYISVSLYRLSGWYPYAIQPNLTNTLYRTVYRQSGKGFYLTGSDLILVPMCNSIAYRYSIPPAVACLIIAMIPQEVCSSQSQDGQATNLATGRLWPFSILCVGPDRDDILPITLTLPLLPTLSGARGRQGRSRSSIACLGVDSTLLCDNCCHTPFITPPIV